MRGMVRRVGGSWGFRAAAAAAETARGWGGGGGGAGRLAGAARGNCVGEDGRRPAGAGGWAAAVRLTVSAANTCEQKTGCRRVSSDGEAASGGHEVAACCSHGLPPSYPFSRDERRGDDPARAPAPPGGADAGGGAAVPA